MRFNTTHEQQVREAAAEEAYQARIDKRTVTQQGDLVQSEGERRIREFLERHSILYEYDARLTLADDGGTPRWTRPDFLLKGRKVIIEYAGMRTNDYRRKLAAKKKLYGRAGYDCIVLTPGNLEHLDIILPAQLLRAGMTVG